MLLVFGVGALIAVVAGHLAWIARSAHSRGHNVLAWVTIGVMAGGLGLAVGLSLYRYASDGEELNATVLMVGVLAVPVSVLAGLLTVLFVLSRIPVRVGRAREWKVHVMKHGPGSVRIDGDSLHLAWPDASRVLARSELRAVEVDGESVRFGTASGDVFVLMPLGGPDHPEYRKAQSKALAGALGSLAAREPKLPRARIRR